MLAIVLSVAVLALLAFLGFIMLVVIPVAMFKSSGLLAACLYLTFVAGLPSAYLIGKDYRKRFPNN